MLLPVLLPVLLPLLVACAAPTEVGDTGHAEDDCLSESAPPIVAACVVYAGTTPADYGPLHTSALNVQGMIVADAGTGSPSSGCLDKAAWIGATDEPSTAGTTTAWALLEHDLVGQVELALTMPGDTLDWDLPRKVNLEWKHEGYDPSEGAHGAWSLEVRALDDTLLAWAVAGPDAADEDPPGELQLDRTEESCSSETECGTRVDHEVLATIGGESTRLEAGQRADLAGYAVALGADVTVASSSECEDGLAPGRSVGLARLGEQAE